MKGNVIMKRFAAVTMTILAAAVMLLCCGCKKTPEQLIVGSWKCIGTFDSSGSTMTQVYKFEENGDCHIYYTLNGGANGTSTANIECSYHIKDGYIYLDKEGEEYVIVYRMKVSEDKLVLTTAGFTDVQSMELERID